MAGKQAGRLAVQAETSGQGVSGCACLQQKPKQEEGSSMSAHNTLPVQQLCLAHHLECLAAGN